MNQLEFIRRILAISQAGLAYATDKFDIERYQDLHAIALNQLSGISDESVEKIGDLFKNENGYPTPEVDVRAFIRQDNRVLLVEDDNHQWALPGGYAEVGWTPSQNVLKEVREETGLTVHVQRLRAIYDTSLRTDIPQPFQYYKMIFECVVDGGAFTENSETIAMQWFRPDELPELSQNRTTEAQLAQLFNGESIHID